jgi:hypothetical protein
LGREQAFDPVDVLNALGDEPLAFTVGPACVLALHRGYLNHVAGSAIAAAPCDQSPQQHRRVQPIGFGPARPAVDLKTARIHHQAGDPLGGEAAVQPEPIVACLVTEDDLDFLAVRPPLAPLQAAK